MRLIELHTPRLFVRNFKRKDLLAFHTYRSKPAIYKFQNFQVEDFKGATDFIKRQMDKDSGDQGDWTQFAIVGKETKRLIGDCGIKLDIFDPGIAEFEITISDFHQQKGYAKEVLTALLNHFFGSRDIHRVEETLDADDSKGLRLMESLGFRQEGHYIHNVLFKGKLRSEVRYGLLASEWSITPQVAVAS